MLRQYLVLSVFLNVLALRQDSRPLYCLLSALYYNEVVACPSFVPAFITQSHLTIGHLTLFPIFSRPFGLPSLIILYYIYKPTQLHHICITVRLLFLGGQNTKIKRVLLCVQSPHPPIYLIYSGSFVIFERL
jgi:hypothetical protein